MSPSMLFGSVMILNTASVGVDELRVSFGLKSGRKEALETHDARRTEPWHSGFRGDEDGDGDDPDRHDDGSCRARVVALSDFLCVPSLRRWQ